jgi:glycosyltransferase involved in cell wall biosynthesis
MSRRVLHYVDTDLFGGSEQAALHLMASLDRSRWEPVLLHHPHRRLEPLVDGAARLGIRTIGIPAIVSGARISGIGRLLRVIRDDRPDVFHAHLSWPLACRHGVLAAWLARRPAIVGTAQLYTEPHGVRRARLRLRPLRRIIAVSREVETKYVRHLGIPARKLSVVPNGIPAPARIPEPDPALRMKLLEGRSGFLVLTLARLHEQKGHADLLAAAAQVPDATFVLAGDGPLRGELEQRARQLGVAGRCVFLGHRRDVPALLAAADVFVLPSLYEGLPVSVLEAMAAGRPVVATAIGGTDEAVRDEVTGLLVPPHDPAALAAAIGRLRADPALARRLAAAGRDRVEREFSSEATALRVMEIYDEVLAGPGHGGGRG